MRDELASKIRSAVFMAAQAGATRDEIDEVVTAAVAEAEAARPRAQDLLAEYRRQRDQKAA